VLFGCCFNLIYRIIIPIYFSQYLSADTVQIILNKKRSKSPKSKQMVKLSEKQIIYKIRTTADKSWWDKLLFP